MSFLENRVPPPLIGILFGVLMQRLSTLSSGIEWSDTLRVLIASVIVSLGGLFCLIGVLAFRRAKTTVNPLKPDDATSLVTSGIYQVSRNPMYVGFALFLVAFGVYLSAPLSFVGVIGFILYMNQFQIKPEERAMEEVFGEEFVIYKSKVRRWL